MKKILSFIAAIFLLHQMMYSQVADSNYLSDIKKDLQKQWPANRTINIVFHGHSVPTGYFRTPDVRTLEAYPYLTLKRLKEKYPYAVINVITTSIGGENALQGAKRFDNDVLNHKPDVLFIDYALNDRWIGIDSSRKAWEEMIQKALSKNIKVILLTPTPDTSAKMLDDKDALTQHAILIRKLADKYHVGLADSYKSFQDLLRKGIHIEDFMSQINHPNLKGHEIVEQEIIKWFE